MQVVRGRRICNVRCWFLLSTDRTWHKHRIFFIHAAWHQHSLPRTWCQHGVSFTQWSLQRRSSLQRRRTSVRNPSSRARSLRELPIRPFVQNHYK